MTPSSLSRFRTLAARGRGHLLTRVTLHPREGRVKWNQAFGKTFFGPFLPLFDMFNGQRIM